MWCVLRNKPEVRNWYCHFAGDRARPQEGKRAGKICPQSSIVSLRVAVITPGILS
jgi:hypothetical protein